MNTCINSLSNYYNSLSFLPEAAVKKDSCTVDRDLLMSRIYKIGLAAIALMVTTKFVSLAGTQFLPSFAILFTAASWTIDLLSITAFVLGIFLEHRRAEKATDEKAVQECLGSNTPSASAYRRIQKSRHAATLLVKNELWNNRERPFQLQLYQEYELPDFAIFKLLVDNGLKVDLLIFQNALHPKSFTHLSYIVKNKLITNKDFWEYQEYACWREVQSCESGQCLKELGLDINIKFENQTPLFHLIDHNYSLDQVKTLLNCGADPKIKGIVTHWKCAGIELSSIELAEKLERKDIVDLFTTWKKNNKIEESN